MEVIKHLPEFFNQEHQEIRPGRKRKNPRQKSIFTPANLFLTLVKLVGGTNNTGYDTALERAFDDLGTTHKTPSRSALSQFRASVSWSFFFSVFQNLIEEWAPHRPKWRGFYVSAIDGDKLTLPHSEDILEKGYKGTPTTKNRETYYPVMYYGCAIDVISGVPIGLKFSPENDEITLGVKLIETCMNKDTVVILDRFYLSKRMLEMYKQTKENGYFIARCKKGSTFKEITQFIGSNKKATVVEIHGVKLRLIKFTPNNGSEEFVLASNLPKKVEDADIGKLYGKRWECETGNRDRTSSLKLEQFRGKSLNNVLQEVFVALFIQATSRILCSQETEQEKSFMKSKYKRSNLKAAMIKLVDKFAHIAIFNCQRNLRALIDLIHRTTQARKRYSRSYARRTRTIVGNLYDHESLIPRRE